MIELNQESKRKNNNKTLTGNYIYHNIPLYFMLSFHYHLKKHVLFAVNHNKNHYDKLLVCKCEKPFFLFLHILQSGLTFKSVKISFFFYICSNIRLQSLLCDVLFFMLYAKTKIDHFMI